MRKSAAIALLVAVALVIPGAVYASHQFNDVPDSHTFHNAIAWMKDNNITVGCNPPANTNYCPDDNVTRGEMAAFMKRLAENNVVDAATLDGADSVAYTNPAAGDVSDNVALPLNTVAELAELSITAPVSGGLVITGVVTPASATSGQATFWLQVDNATCTFDVANFYSVFYGRVEQTGNAGTSASASGVAAVAAGPHTVTFCGRTFTLGPLTVEASLNAEFATSVTRTGSISSAGDGGDAGAPTS
jgi:hypothetical protein